MPRKRSRRLVFVSHSAQDTWVAKQIAREISACGATPFLDEANIDAGGDFEQDIRDFINKADEVSRPPYSLGAGSPLCAPNSAWAELGVAWGRGIPLIALLLGLTPAELQTHPGVPMFLKKRNILELNGIETYLKQLRTRRTRSGK